MFDTKDSPSVDLLLDFPEEKSELISDDAIIDELKQEEQAEEFQDYEFLDLIRSEIRDIDTAPSEEIEKILAMLPANPKKFRLFQWLLRSMGWKYFRETEEGVDLVRDDEGLTKNLREYNEEIGLGPDLEELIPDESDYSGPSKKLKVEEIEDKGQLFQVARGFFLSDTFRKIKKKFFKSDMFISFDISTSSVKYVQMRKKDGKFILDRYQIERVDIEPGAEKGVLRSGLVSALQKIMPYDLLELSDVYVSLNCINIITKSETFPSLDSNDLKEAINYKARKDLPESMTDPEVQYEIIETSGSKDEKKNLVRIFIYDKKELSEWLVLLSSVGVEPSKLSLAHSGIESNLRNFSTESRDAGSIVFDLGRNKSQLLFVKNGMSRVIRIIDFGTKNFISALTGTFTIADEKISIDKKKAQDLLHSYGIPGEGSVGNSKNKIPLTQLRTRLFQSVESLINELRRNIEFYTKSFPDANLGSLLLMGGGANIINIRSIIEEKLGIETKSFTFLNKLSVGRDITETDRLIQESSSLSGAVGLALDNTHALNLLPRDQQNAKKKNLAILGVVSTFIFSILILINVSMNIMDEKNRVAAASDEVEKRFQENLPVISEYQSVTGQIANINNRQNYVDDIFGIKEDQTQMSTIFRILSTFTPDDIVLNHVSIQERAKENVFTEAGVTVQLSPLKIYIEGRSEADDIDNSILDYILQLRKLPYFSEVVLQADKASKVKDKKNFQALLTVPG